MRDIFPHARSPVRRAEQIKIWTDSGDCNFRSELLPGLVARSLYGANIGSTGELSQRKHGVLDQGMNFGEEERIARRDHENCQQ